MAPLLWPDYVVIRPSCSFQREQLCLITGKKRMIVSDFAPVRAGYD
jgi:hypothetical protein